MNRGSFALPARTILMVALITATITSGNIENNAATGERASAARSDAAPIVLAQRCFYQYGRLYCI